MRRDSNRDGVMGVVASAQLLLRTVLACSSALPPSNRPATAEHAARRSLTSRLSRPRRICTVFSASLPAGFVRPIGSDAAAGRDIAAPT